MAIKRPADAASICRILCGTILAFVLLIWVDGGYAKPLLLSDTERAWIADNPTVRVGIDGAYAPYSFIDKSGHYAGLAVDVLKEIGAMTGLTFEPVYGLNWQDIETGARNRTLDVVATMVKTANRTTFMNFTDIYISTPLVIMARKGDNRILSASDLDGRTVAFVRHYSTSEKVLREHPAVIPKRVETPLQGLKAVAVGEADAYVGVLGVNTHLARQYGLANIRVAAQYGVERNGQRLAVRSDWPELRTILQKALDNLDPANMAAIYEKWVPVLYDPAASNRVRPFRPSEKEVQWLDSRKEIRIGAMSDWPPMDFVDADGNPQGIGADFLRAVNRRLKGKITIVSGDWSDLLKKVADGQLDGVIGITPSPEREKSFHFTKPYVVVPHTFFARKDVPFIESVSQLAGKHIAVERNFFLAGMFRQRHPNIALKLYDTTAQALDAVVRHEAEAYIGNRAAAIYTIQNELISTLKAHGTFAETESVNAIGVRKNEPILRDILQKALDSLTPQERRLILKDWVAPELFEAPPFVLTPEEKDWLSAHPVIRVGGDRAWAPVEFIGAQDAFEGIAVDYLDILSKQLDVRFEFDMTSDWKTVVRKLKDRELDMFSAAAATPSRKEYASFTPPYLSLPAVIFSRRTSPVGPSITALEGKRVASVRNYAITEFLKRADAGLTLVETDSVDQGLEYLRKEKVDAYIGSILVTGHAIRKAGLTNIVVTGQTPFGINVSMGIRKDWPVFAKVMHRALSHISEQQHTKIVGRWIGVEVPNPPNYRLLLAISIAVALVILAAAVWIWVLRMKAMRLANDLSSRNVDLRNEITERMVAEQRAQSANRAKSEFLANISHEFRTPLNAIVGYIQLIRMELGNRHEKGKVAEYTEDLNTASGQLLSLVNNTLDLSVIEEKSFTLDIRDVAVSEVFKDVGTIIQPALDAKRIDLIWPTTQSIVVKADKERLNQILLNVIDNAVKYSPEDSRIIIAVKVVKNREVEFSVTDPGIGMDQETIEKVFRPFTRGDDPMTRSSVGAGLGLSISERLVRLHGGRMEIDSTPGQGTCVRFCLPRAGSA